MSQVQFVVFHLTLSSLIHRSPGLIQLPPVESNLILETEAAIRSTIQDIFSMLNTNRLMEKPNLKSYGILHNYFTSLSFKDYNSLKEIVQLTRVDNKNIDNTTHSFITMINGILNAERDENNTKFHGLISEDAANYLKSYLKELNYFEKNVAEGPRVDVNEEVAKVLQNSHIKDFNITEAKYNTSDENNEDNILDTSEFWRPNTLENRRIFNGRRTHIKTFPFMAVVQIFNVFQCAGSIIHGDLILTAASCLQLAYNNRFYRENPAFVSVRVGTNFHDGGGESIGVLEIFFHPEYNPRTLKNNLAVIRLVRFLKFASSRVKKIAIDTTQATLPANSRGITLVGWGAKSPVNVIKNGWYNRLSYSILDIYGLQDCMEIYSREYITHKHFCAGFISKGSGACNRDVGGPGVAAGILRGVVSFGSPQCGTPDAPTVFTKVGYYADWIETIMEQANIPRGRVMSTLRTTPWTLPFQRPSPRTTWDVNTPVVKKNTPLVEYETVTTARPVARQSKKVNMKRFKDFLRTMFDSKEIDDYINQFIDEKGIGRQNKARQLTTESTYAVEYASKNIYLESQSKVKSEVEDRFLYTAIPENVTDYTESIINLKEAEDENELEQDILELINSLDMKNMLIGTSFDDSPLSKSGQAKNKNNKKVDKIMGDKKIKKKMNKGEKLLKKNVPSTIELLYLSQEDELGNGGVDPIYIKGDKDDSEQQHMLLGVQDNDIEDIVRDDGEDTAEIAKKLEAITILPDIPDVPGIPEIPEIPEPYEAGSKLNINFKSKNKIDEIAESNFLSKKLIVDILNEVIKSESKMSE